MEQRYKQNKKLISEIISEKTNIPLDVTQGIQEDDNKEYELLQP